MNEEANSCLATPGNNEPCGEGRTEVNPNKIREVKIEQLNHGYLVRVGCQRFAIETSEKLLSLLSDYMKFPADTEKAWFDGKLLK